MESNGVAEVTNENGGYDLASILFSAERDYLVRNNGDQVIFHLLFLVVFIVGY